MPQMSPMLWVLLYIYSLLVIMLIMVMLYYLVSSNLCKNESFKKMLKFYKIQW